MDEVAIKKWTKMPSDATITSTVAAMQKRGFTVITVDNKAKALQKLKQLLPAKAEVMTGSSTTLGQIGFMEYYMSGKNPWKCLGPEVYNEKDPVKQKLLRRKSDTAEYFVASVNAVAATGELVACDRSGSRVSAYPFAADHVVLVVGVQKIMKTLDEAIKRVREYVFNLENERAMKAYGTPSGMGKWVIIENEYTKDRITIILCKESIGF
ncbi:MAG TPA: lactate utilization protein [Candidatus Lokiarchaeia archaeon]|nr:lactate utilization protein [Candidatus Lokiarchaeia archaeon]